MLGAGLPLIDADTNRTVAEQITLAAAELFRVLNRSILVSVSRSRSGRLMLPAGR